MGTWNVRERLFHFVSGILLLGFLFAACTRKNDSNGAGYSGRPLNTVITSPSKVHIEKIAENRYRFSGPAGTVKRAEGPVEEVKIGVWNVDLSEVQRIGSSQHSTESVDGLFVTSFAPKADGSFYEDVPFQLERPYFILFVSDAGDSSSVPIPAAKGSEETTAVYSKIENGVPGESGTVFREALGAAVGPPSDGSPLAAPVVTSVSPTSSTLSGGHVTIRGSSFSMNPMAVFGQSLCTNLVRVSEFELQCDVPPHVAGTFSITVINDDNQSAVLSNSFTFFAPPSLSAVNPATGSSSGGTLAVISGSSFRNGAIASIGGVACASTTFVDSTTLLCTTAGHVPGSFPIEVVNPDSQLDNSGFLFSYVTPPAPPPTVSTINPVSGSTAGGVSVTITGSDFQSGARVSLGGVDCSVLVVTPPTQITCITSAGSAGVVDVIVSNPDGQSGTKVGAFTYQTPVAPPPSLTGVNPASGSTGGGTAITLSGSNFQNGATVLVGGAACSNIVVTPPSQIACYTPAGSAGLASVSVINPDSQSSTGSGLFTYVTPIVAAWVATSSSGAPEGRWGLSAVWSGSKMIVWGGRDFGQYFDNGGMYDPVADTWSPMNRIGAPTARQLHSAIWTGAKMIVWGGLGASGMVNTGGIYDPVLNAWTSTSVSGFVPGARTHHTAIWAENRMIIWGGSNASGTAYNTGGMYDLSTNTWVATAMASAPSARYEHTAVWTGSKMIIWGGRDSSSTFNSGGLFDPSSNTWNATSIDPSISTRFAHSAVWTGSKMIIWGGQLVAKLNSGGIYDPIDNTWTVTNTSTAPSARKQHSAVWTGSRMIVWGGDSMQATGGLYDPVADEWIATSNMDAPSGRYVHGCVWTGGKMIVWGGMTGGASSTGGVYTPPPDPEADSWTATNLTGAPERRRHFTAIWTGSKMIVWGGENTGRRNTGGQYDPISDTWTATNTVGAPAARMHHTAVWTGSKMIIWGGMTNTLSTAAGLYDPILDSWSSTPSSGDPDKRYYHTAIWTGSKMIAWGGTVNGATNTGRIYYPPTNSWHNMSTLGAPTARLGPQSVWTGTRMIVWGGGDSPVTNSGATYDPESDTWAPMTQAAAPSARANFTMVWTGAKAIIFGGNEASTGLVTDTGAAYDPNYDLWTALPVGIAAARANHTAVWTGSKMLVWSGVAGLAPNFAAYSPETNSWATLSETNAPSVRGYHNAVWTGREMIVWGGYNGGTFLDTGGVYVP